MQKTKFCALLLFSVMIVEIFTLPPTFSSLMNSVVMKSTGKISLLEITAESGSPEDIQAAVDAVVAAGGGNVYVPEGNFTFNPNDAPSSQGVQIPGGVNVFGAGKNKTILQQTYRATGIVSMFYVDGRNGKPSRISGFTFIAYTVDELNGSATCGVTMFCVKNFRVDHCRFIDFNHFGVSAAIYTVAVKPEGGELQYYWNWGVVDNCDFDLPYKDTIGGVAGYGVSVGGPGRIDSWLYNLSDILGQIPETPPKCAKYQWNASTNQYDLIDPYGGKFFRWLVYIEDCTFSRCRHSIASNAGAFYVARNCTFKEPRPTTYGMIDVHGALAIDSFGGRGAEIYNNTIYGKGFTISCGTATRGGGGVIFNNTFIDCKYGVGMSRDQVQLECLVKDLWIWNNTFQNVQVPIYDQFNDYTEEVDYFLRERPGYTPYPYPHPLTLET